jgi:hypothetical protein
MGRVVIILPLVAVLWALLPLAYAAPPDPTNVHGIWDDADHDDVVILATSSSGATDSHSQSDLAWQLVVAALLPLGAHGVFLSALPASHAPRSPPTDLI